MNGDGLLDIVLSGQIYNYVDYDVSKIPDAIYLNNGNDIFIRLSEYRDLDWNLVESRVAGQEVGTDYIVNSWGVTNESEPKLFFIGQDANHLDGSLLPNAIITFAAFDFA